ncbi:MULTISPECIES: hypothetical protein [unclassified Bradyrhizobium]|uniref:hypothetical protein n=1 Tax=unclassified Bradyrhizobium TaxID=2631580 RepID=UPI001FF9AA70|nr:MULTISPECIES: hypothetical protein [unclassified Bradyrhizobium]MCK1669668.1 hypothetical protein [Bradyrhizobium sp. 153]MCK1757508.1 hypothetical protein [Bradyrhizobium sp. 137]
MTELERAWREWRALSRRDRAVFLALLRQDYARQRAAALRRRGCAHGLTVSRLADLALSEADLNGTGHKPPPMRSNGEGYSGPTHLRKSR